MSLLNLFLNQTKTPGRRRWSWHFQGYGSALAPALLILSGALLACMPVRSKPAIVGIYELTAGGEKIVLEISPDDSFTETISFASGKVEKHLGKWYWSSGRVSFDELWIPKSFAPDYIIRADSGANTGQPKYSELGHWSMSAENHWGTTFLPVFPDANINFKMVKR